MGEKVAITAHQAQTTRTSIQGVLTTPEAQIVFVDTPGIHKSDTLFNKRMMDTVRGALQDRDLVIYVADATKPVGEEDEHAVSALNKTGQTLLVLNKIDRISDKRLLLPVMERYNQLFPFSEVFPLGGAHRRRTRRHSSKLSSNIFPKGRRFLPDDYLTDQPARFMAAEIVRESILENLRDEVPHATAILVDTWEEKPKLVKIAATIYVERPGQKAILIGAQGQMLKKIGIAARLQLEKLLVKRFFFHFS